MRNARVDNSDRRRKIDTARDIIYHRNYAVDSSAVEAVLQEQSLVPNVVSEDTQMYVNVH